MEQLNDLVDPEIQKIKRMIDKLRTGAKRVNPPLTNKEKDAAFTAIRRLELDLAELHKQKSLK